VRFRCVCVEMSSASRVFQVSRTSGDGAQPRTKMARSEVSFVFGGDIGLVLGMLTARMNEACEPHTGNMTGAAEDALKVPDCLCTVCTSV
jgi:hypothetical protein